MGRRWGGGAFPRASTVPPSHAGPPSPDLRAGEDALRRWVAAAALVRPQGDGGTVVVVAEPTLRPVQALVRWDPVGHAVRELSERAELGFPPVSRMAAVSGTASGTASRRAAAAIRCRRHT